MIHTIRLEPSGHTFECEQHESLLEAALRNGINVDHHCASGTCGECQARLLSGEIERMHHDFTFTAAQKLQGMLLLCSTVPQSDLVLEAATAASPADIPLQQIHAQVRRIEPLRDDYLSITLRTPRTRTLRFMAGQSAKLGFEHYPPVMLPIASCPCNGMMLQFHLRRRYADPLHDFLFEQLRPGASVSLEGPCGYFTLDDESRRPILLVALETGFAPIKSLIEHAIALELPQPIHLFWYTHDPNGHYQANYCRAWKDVLDDFNYYPRVLSPRSEQQGDYSQVVAELRAMWRELGDLDIYLAADDPMVEAVIAAAVADGVDPARLMTQHGCTL